VFKYYKDEAIRRIELFVFYSANDWEIFFDFLGAQLWANAVLYARA